MILKHYAESLLRLNFFLQYTYQTDSSLQTNIPPILGLQFKLSVRISNYKPMLTCFFLGLIGGLASCAPIPDDDDDDDAICSSYNENKFVEDSAFNVKKKLLYSHKCCS